LSQTTSKAIGVAQPLQLSHCKGKNEEEQIKLVAKWAHSQRGVKACGKPYNSTLWNFVNGGEVNCLGMATVVLAACEVLRIRNVFSVFSETHVWIAFVEEEEPPLLKPPSLDDPRLRFIEVNDVHFAGEEVKAERKDTWMYHGFKGATMCDVGMHSRILLSGIKLEDPSLHLEMLRVMNENSEQPLPRELLEIGDCLSELGEPAAALEYYSKSIAASEDFFHGSHVIPHIWRADAHHQAGNYELVLEDCFNAMRVVSQFKYSHHDDDLLALVMDEVLETAVDMCCDKGVLQTPKFISFMDHSMSWFEKWSQLKNHIALVKLLTRMCKSQITIGHLQTKMATGQLKSAVLKRLALVYGEKSNWSTNKISDLMSSAWPH
jgi:tetratricopeptide (TPR) repeat protein